jgi:hypothetical protein
VSRESPFGRTTVGLKRLIRREVDARAQLAIGTVISRLKLYDDDGLGSATWVCDVAVGKLRPLRDVQVKAGADGSRFYASLGHTVQLARNTQGRFDVVGPGDRLATIAKVKKYKLGDSTPVSTSNLGLTVEVLPFEYLKGPTPGTPGTSLWGDGVTPLKTVRVVDGDGNPV